MRAFVNVLSLEKRDRLGTDLQIRTDIRKAASSEEALGASVVEAMAKFPGYALTSQSCIDVTDFVVRFVREHGEAA